MAMEINGTLNFYKADDPWQMKTEQEKTKEAAKEGNDKKASEGIPAPQDEYISSEKAEGKPVGLYQLRQDENGNPKIIFNAPEKSEDAGKKGQPERKQDDPEESVKECTTNTDKVDREIRKLKEKKQQLEQQINTASGDEKKVEELEKKLAQVESELSRKDNDTYRRQNASVTG